MRTTSRDTGALVLAACGLGAGAVARVADAETVASVLWIATTLLGAALSTWWVIDAARHHRLGVDVIALLALLGALIVGEHLAGALIAVMLTTGRALEAWAAGRAERELHALLARAPQVAHRYEPGGLTDPPLDQLALGDVLLVRPGEMVPVDGTVQRGPAVVDESALTGESLPVQRDAGDEVRAGAVNAGGQFDLIATTTAAESTYAGIVRLVQQSSAASAPFVRTADRFALAFVGATLVVAGVAWAIAGELGRAVAVLVVATPCPLILAAPVAIVAGLSRSAHRGVVVKGGAALEGLASAEILLFDKTGTLTGGRATVDEVVPATGFDPADVLQLAASLDQASPHVLAAALVRAAHERGLRLSIPTDTCETPGAGIRGGVAGREVAVGHGSWIGVDVGAAWVRRVLQRSELDGALAVYVSVGGVPAGAVVFTDPVRPDAARTIRNLRRAGIRRVVMVTGDRTVVARAVGALVGLDAIEAEQSPADKVAVVTREMAGGPTIMVGDGINDAPALALATVGVAIGGRGSTASSEAADVILTIDRLDRLGEARLVARRSRAIATQSVVAGMGLSLVAMAVAASGHLSASWGALLQELIDASVILNALRALRPGRDERRLDVAGATIAHQYIGEHHDLRPGVGLLRAAADGLGDGRADAMVLVRAAHRLLVDEIEPHEQDEDRQLYPVIASLLGGTDPTGTMSRAHVEIGRLTGQLGTLIERVGEHSPGVPAVPDPADRRELQRVLYGLYAVLELHFAQEDEHYLSLADDAPSEPV